MEQYRIKIRKQIQDNLDKGNGLFCIRIHGVKGLSDEIQHQTKQDLYEILKQIKNTIQIGSAEEYVLYMWSEDKSVANISKNIFFPYDYFIKELRGKTIEKGLTTGYIKPKTKLKEVEPLIEPFIQANI